MNIVTDTIQEQLSALMDGELPDAEARFLQRRIQASPQLQAQWARMQVASSCLKGQPWMPARQGLCLGVAQAIENETIHPTGNGFLRWGVAASLVALAVLIGPRLMTSVPAPAGSVATAVPAQGADHLIASPGSADLVATRTAAVDNAIVEPRSSAAATAVASGSVALVASNVPASTVESPLPLSAQSPTDFPLVDGGDKRSWPRSGLAQATNDPALEAYLVRHNQMLANDGLGGFVPYLDVVATDQAGSAAAPADAAANSTSGQGEGQQ